MEENIVENSVVDQVAPVEASNHESQAEQPQVESRQDKNWKAIRQRNAELEQKMKLQEEMMAQVLAASQHMNRVEPIQELEDPEDDIPTNGKVKKVARKEVEPLQKRIDHLEQELVKQNQMRYFDGLRRQYSDFDQVVNPETLTLLEETDPELAKTIADQKDPYKIALQSYKFIKSMNLVKPQTESRQAMEAEKKLEKNSKTVQSPLAYGKRPIAQAFNYADVNRNKTLQNELYQEMTAYASQIGFGY